MRPDKEEGKVVYKLKVEAHPLMCTACPSSVSRG
jgi:hypothetical protein